MGLLTPRGIAKSLYCRVSSGAMRGWRNITPCDKRRASLITALYKKRFVVRMLHDIPWSAFENSPGKASVRAQPRLVDYPIEA
jgi:hypothetical protein